MEKTYFVAGMTCNGCAKSVTNAIKATYPSAAVQVQLEDGKVRIAGDIDDQQIATVVEDAGFSYGGLA